MSYKTLLVYLDEAEDAGVRLDAAMELAMAHVAHLSALGVSLQSYPYYAAGGEEFNSTFDVEEFEATCKRAADIAAKAKARLAASTVSGDTRWASHEAIGLTDTAARQARHADLAIAGQPVDGPHYTLRQSVLDGALFSSGRPVLMLPAKWKPASIGRRIVVAWDGSQQASRAINDALPLIDKAEETRVVIVDPVAGSPKFGEEPGADITAVVARHCRKAGLDRIPSGGKNIAEALLTRAMDAAADLIVMGAYGHSQIREAIFGGVSREMIHTSRLPLLLSH